jgi:hypothetical protein
LFRFGPIRYLFSGVEISLYTWLWYNKPLKTLPTWQFFSVVKTRYFSTCLRRHPRL